MASKNKCFFCDKNPNLIYDKNKICLIHKIEFMRETQINIPISEDQLSLSEIIEKMDEFEKSEINLQKNQIEEQEQELLEQQKQIQQQNNLILKLFKTDNDF